jgi:hypothetical protein
MRIRVAVNSNTHPEPHHRGEAAEAVPRDQTAAQASVPPRPSLHHHIDQIQRPSGPPWQYGGRARLFDAIEVETHAEHGSESRQRRHMESYLYNRSDHEHHHRLQQRAPQPAEDVAREQSLPIHEATTIPRCAR